MDNEVWAFFSAFLKEPRVVASVVQSSSFLEQRVIRLAELSMAGQVVELGPGTGSMTRSLLKAMGPHGRLLAIERTPEFRSFLEQIEDKRLEVVNGCASSVGEELANRGAPAVDAVISGIPFSTMPKRLAADIAAAVHDVLRPGGKFVAYQISDRVADYARPVMGDPDVELELRNVPPVRVFAWQKTSDGAGTSVTSLED